MRRQAYSLKYDLRLVFIFDAYIFQEYEWAIYLHFMLKHDTGKPFRDVFDKVEVVDVLTSLIDIFSRTETTLTTGKLKYNPHKTSYVTHSSISLMASVVFSRRKSCYTLSFNKNSLPSDQIQQPVVSSAKKSHFNSHKNLDRRQYLSSKCGT